MMPTRNETLSRRTGPRLLSRAPSGRQFDIGFGTQRATVVEVGGGIRAYRDADRDILHPYDLDSLCDGAHGAALIPWPNRLRDGRYRFDGVDYRLPLTEPDKHNAIHGLLRWQPWHPVRHDVNRVVVATTLHPQPGYPFTLDIRIDYLLNEEGLTVRTTASNIGDTPAPYGCGQHQYLSPGTGEIDACTLTFDASTRIVTDTDRQLPTGVEPVHGTPFDFRKELLLGDLQIDFAFTDLARDRTGRAWVGLRGTDGATAQLWLGKAYPVLEIFTADTLAPDRRRRGLGVEPMSCPPDAFNTGDQLLRLEPGESATTAWGARLVRD
jgi:aldose 1-epimerase